MSDLTPDDKTVDWEVPLQARPAEGGIQNGDDVCAAARHFDHVRTAQLLRSLRNRPKLASCARVRAAGCAKLG